MTPFFSILIQCFLQLLVLLSIFSLAFYRIIEFQLDVRMPTAFSDSLGEGLLVSDPGFIGITVMVLCCLTIIKFIAKSFESTYLKRTLGYCLNLVKTINNVLQYMFLKNFILSLFPFLKRADIVILFIIFAGFILFDQTSGVASLQPYGGSSPDDLINEFKNIKIKELSGDEYPESLESILKEIKKPPGGNLSPEALQVINDLKKGRKHWDTLNIIEKSMVEQYLLDNYWALLIGVRADRVEVASLTLEMKNILLNVYCVEEDYLDRLELKAYYESLENCLEWLTQAKTKEDKFEAIGQCMKDYYNPYKPENLHRLYRASLRAQMPPKF